MIAAATALLCAAPAAAMDSPWHRVTERSGTLQWTDAGQWRLGQQHGTFPFPPDDVALADDAVVALAGRAGAADGPVVAVLGLDGTERATLSLGDLVGSAVDGFWRPGGDEVAWRVDHWLTDGRLIVVPDAPGQPVAISLADGLVENPEPDVFVHRLLQADLWFGRRLRALELAGAGPRTATLDRALRSVVVESSAPLVLRLRAAALLAEVGDSTGRSLVLLTARSPAVTRRARVDDHQLVLPVPSQPCDQPPGTALHLPYDEDAARSYAIRLLPALLDVDAVPLLRPLLGSGEEQDRKDAALALGCLAQEHPEIGHRLAERPPTRRLARPRGLAAVGSQGTGDRLLKLLFALLPMAALGLVARRR